MREESKEVELVNIFINKGILKGWFIGEVPIGRKRLRQRDIGYPMGMFYVDMICVEGIYEKKPIKFNFRYEDFILKEIKHKWVWLLEIKRN